MSVNVIAWPPVKVTGVEWSEIAPVSVSRSLISGKRYTSGSQRVRRVATLIVSGTAGDGMGGAFCEVLKSLLAGGENLVRLNSLPVSSRLTEAALSGVRQSVPVDWTDDGGDVAWVDGAVPLYLYDHPPIVGVVTTDQGFPALSVTGAPADQLIARPGEYLTVFADESDLVGETVRVLTVARADSNGEATIRLFEAPTISGRVNFGTQVSAVFEVDGPLPRSVRVPKGDWSYTWKFREVFEDEVGGFVELDPWT